MEELSLKWSGHQSSVVSSLASLYSCERLTDVVIACDSREFSVHKLVLAMCSEYFDGLFERNPHLQAPGLKAVVMLKNVQPRPMELLLQYMYNGQVTMQENEFIDFLTVAKSLQVKGLAIPDYVGERQIANADVQEAVCGGEEKDEDDTHITRRPSYSDEEAIESDTSLDHTDEESQEDNTLGKELNFRLIPGRVKGSEQYVCKGKIYIRTRDNRRKGDRRISYLRCRHMRRSHRDRCPGLAILKFKTNRITETRPHTCEDNDVSISVVEAKREMVNLAMTTTRTLRSIFDSVLSKRPEAAEFLDFQIISSTMGKRRKQALAEMNTKDESM